MTKTISRFRRRKKNNQAARDKDIRKNLWLTDIDVLRNRAQKKRMGRNTIEQGIVDYLGSTELYS